MKQFKTSFLILFFLISIFLLARSFYPIIKRGIYLLDFVLYYYPVGQYLKQNLNLYQLSQNPVLYPPPFLLILSLLHLLPLISGQYIWTFLSLLSLFLSLWLILKINNLKPTIKWFLFLSPFLFLSFPAKFTLAMGQVNHFILLFFTLGFYFYQQKKENLSAFLFTLSFLIKLFPIWTLFFFFQKKDWGLIKKISLFTILAFILSSLFLPLQIIKDFSFFVLPSFLGHTANSSYYNQALTGLISRLISHPQSQTYIFLILSFYLIFLTWKKIQKPLADPLKFSLLITLSFLIAPVAWQHHLVFLFFPILSLFTYFQKTKKTKSLLILLLAYFFIFINIKNPQLFQSNLWGKIILSHATISALIIYFLGLTTSTPNPG